LLHLASRQRRFGMAFPAFLLRELYRMTWWSLPCLWEQGIPQVGEVGEAIVLRITTPSEDY